MATDKGKALTWTELRVGLLAIASLVILAFTTLYIGSGGGSPFSKKYTIKVLMSDVNGLKEGAPVRVGGVEVGTVTKVDFASGSAGMVEVSMKLDERIKARVTTQSHANLGSLGMLGEKAVDITASAQGAPIQDGGYLPPGSEDQFKGLLTDAGESTAHLKKILARMDAGEGLIGKALRDEELYDRMTDVAVRLQAVATKLESSQGPLGRLVNDEEMSRRLASSAQGIDAVVTRIEKGEGPLGALSKDEQMVKNLKAISASMGEVAGKLERGEGSLGKMLTDEQLYTRMNELSQRLDGLLVKMEQGEGSLGRLLNDPAFYNNLDGAATEVRSLVGDIRKDPGKYLRVKVSLF
jgi:phospholipid/cholesterol/gamma-HCH transport system substrate-binding protein